MRLFILLTTFLLGCTYTWAQNDWVEHTQEQGIVFLAKDLTCDFGGGTAVEYKVLQIKNTTAQKARISYRIATHYVNHPETGEHSPESGGVLELNPGESLTGGCNNTFPARLEVLVRNPNLPNPPAFSHFLIKSISIDWIE